MKLSYTAEERDSGRKVYHILKRELRLSDGQVKRLKNAGGITLDGSAVFTDARVSPKETLEVDLGLAESAPDFPPERGELDVLYENGAYLAVNKPAGMLVHPSRSRYTGTLANYAAGYLLAREGSAACHAVNRLDRDTSGVVLFAKNAHFKTLAVDALRAAESEKVYIAYLFGALPDGSGTIDLPVERAEDGKMLRKVTTTGRRAVTYYETLRSAEVCGHTLTEVRLRLETGRTHQIRVHCLHMGAPLIGDALYGTAESDTFSREMGFEAQLLHCAQLGFREQLSGEYVRINAPVLRDDMIKCEKFFGKSIDKRRSIL